MVTLQVLAGNSKEIQFKSSKQRIQLTAVYKTIFLLENRDMKVITVSISWEIVTAKPFKNVNHIPF